MPTYACVILFGTGAQVFDYYSLAGFVTHLFDQNKCRSP